MLGGLNVDMKKGEELKGCSEYCYTLCSSPFRSEGLTPQMLLAVSTQLSNNLGIALSEKN